MRQEAKETEKIPAVLPVETGVSHKNVFGGSNSLAGSISELLRVEGGNSSVKEQRFCGPVCYPTLGSKAGALGRSFISNCP